MRLRALAPFAIAAALIAVGSSVAVLSTAREGAIAPLPGATASPTASLAPRAVPALSKASRLAFWRDGKLWVSDLDGSLRQAIASTDDLRRVSLTRWATDGSAVAFVDAGLSLAVVGIDGHRKDVDVPSELRSSGYRIGDIRWSPDARRVAATLLRAGDGRSDAFVADLSAQRPTWSRLTALDDLFIGDWISNDELLGYTAAGVIAVIGANEPNAIRLLIGVTGVSPIVGPEGRIHFLVGSVPRTRDPSLPFVTSSRASVWSAATDGSDVRREAAWELNDVRLDARLPDGRYLVHRGSSAAQATVSEDVQLLPTDAGVIERVRLAPDGRSAFGFTLERIVRIDLARLSATPPASPAGSVSVFLDTSGESDVWFPSQLSLARGGARAAAAPATRYAFALGGHVWQMEGGVASLLRVGPLLRRTQVPPPRWSPAGDHLLLMEQAGIAFASATLVAVAIDRNGVATRLERSTAAARSFAWSPDGGQLAVVVDARGVSGVGIDAQLEVRFLDPSGRPTRAPFPGAEVTWTAKGILVLAEVGGATALQRLEGEGQARTMVTRERLTADPRAEPSRSTAAAVTALDAPLDGSYASVRLQTQDASTTRSYFVVIGPDGDPLMYLRGDNLADPAWSPAGALLGYTLDIRTPTERAVVSSATGDVLATHDGRFAGWSPDGKWFHVARTTGLFAYPVEGGAAVRVGPVGVPVSVAAARAR